MWWDGICYDWHCGSEFEREVEEDLEMQDVMFQTISAILFLDSQHCQKSALHGLGHLHHPETQTLVPKVHRSSSLADRAGERIRVSRCEI